MAASSADSAKSINPDTCVYILSLLWHNKTLSLHVIIIITAGETVGYYSLWHGLHSKYICV